MKKPFLAGQGTPAGSLSRVRFPLPVGFSARFPVGFGWCFRLGFKGFALTVECMYLLCLVGSSVSLHQVSHCGKIGGLKEFYLHVFS